MILERQGEMLAQPRTPRFPLLITTNGTVKKNGECVMGRGIARQVRDLHPSFARDLGDLISQYGNRPFRVRLDMWTLPVKRAWHDKADPGLIKASLEDLGEMLMKFDCEGAHMPRPGCGNGGLDWKEVRPLVEEFAAGLPELVFHVWDYGREKGA